MSGTCPLCERGEAAYEVYRAHLVATAWDERLGFVALKRDLEACLDLSLSVTRVKRHFQEHVVYVFDPAEPTTTDDPVHGEVRPSRDARESGPGWRR